MQPLVQKARDLFNTEKSTFRNSPVANKGLLFERFYDGYNADFSINKNADSSFLNDMVGHCGNANELNAAACRRVKLINSLGGEIGVFTTDWHFVSGMGNSHPAENGFTWHHSLGTPYLPGSAVKGLLRAWMEVWATQEGETSAQGNEKIRQWFGGAADVNDQGKAGDLIFFDAIPINCPKLLLDIMTPHMGKWYESGAERMDKESLPGDWHAPIPVSFLVTSDAQFLFSIASRNEAGKAYVKEAMEQLKEALKWLGSGAKTAAGYGHMSYDEEATLKVGKTQEELAEIDRRQKSANFSSALADAGFAAGGSQTWEDAQITKMIPGKQEIYIKLPDEKGTVFKDTRPGPLSDNAKKRLKRGKPVKVRVEVEFLGNRIKLISLEEVGDGT
ncbi:hypothetical protein AAEX37_02016 [Oligella sp. MSHR50489EDL]|uniref:type III-B CRISPR module RAMP protein Cmr6 n=1 Tax=Oligella sp. MSHR50489EDL TaxID=3139409 RepID=UPI003D815707